jgi:hypothetical protein
MTKMDPKVLADLMVGHVKGAIDGPLVADRFQALGARMAALEAKPHVKFCGGWKRENSGYKPGDAVVHRGRYGSASRNTGEPMNDFIGWQMAVREQSITG